MSIQTVSATELTAGPSNLTFCLQLSWCQPSQMKTEKIPNTQNCAIVCYRRKFSPTPACCSIMSWSLRTNSSGDFCPHLRNYKCHSYSDWWLILPCTLLSAFPQTNLWHSVAEAISILETHPSHTQPWAEKAHSLPVWNWIYLQRGINWVSVMLSVDCCPYLHFSQKKTFYTQPPFSWSSMDSVFERIGKKADADPG